MNNQINMPREKDFNMLNESKLFVSTAFLLALTACGGGASSPPPTTSEPPTLAPSDLLPIQYSNYPAGSAKAYMFDQLNAARTQCGFGGLRHDTRLDRAEQAHTDYIIRNNYEPTHFEQAGDPFFTGVNSFNRAVSQGYNPMFESGLGASGQSIALIGEGISPFNSENPNLYRSHIPIQLSTVYHSLGALRPYKDVGFGLTTGSVYGFRSRTMIGHKIGSESPSQKIAEGEVKTYPCEGTTAIRTFHPDENPNPLPGRNLNSNPPGHPVVMLSRSGSKLTEIAVVMQNTATGADVPMAAVRTVDNDSSGLMHRNAAFAIPNVELAMNTSYRVKVTGKVDGRSFENNFTFSTGSYDKAAERSGRVD
jgi:hypothetical protein